MRLQKLLAAGVVVASAASMATVARADDDPPGFAFGEVGRPVFEHLYADILDPRFGMRVYWDKQVPGTLHEVADPNAPGANAVAAAPNGNHFFWDVALGERVPLVGWYDQRSCPRTFSCGVALELVAAAYVLLDLSSQSTGVLDADFRIGGSLDFRPWVPGFNHLSLSLGYFHQSSHLGDEYVLSASTIQGTVSPPQVNPFLPYRANPSVAAFPIVLSIDTPEVRAVRFRVYGGVTFLATTDLLAGPQFRAGSEIRWNRALDQAPASPTYKWRRNVDLLLAYDVLLQHRFAHLGPIPGPAVFEQIDGYWVTQHGMLMALYNLDVARSSTNALGLAVEILWGRVQHGQFLEYATVSTAGASVSYYW